MKNVQTRGKAKKEIPKNVPSIFILGINSAIINCEDIINSRLDRETVETRQGDGNRFKIREECARERKGGRDYDEGQGSGDNERGVNHPDQTVLLTIRAAEKRRLCI